MKKRFIYRLSIFGEGDAEIEGDLKTYFDNIKEEIAKDLKHIFDIDVSVEYSGARRGVE